ncbi:12050_t:CDS:2 [Ambispora leptoticha]|uniref:12050_t:CDS:1 n=1 Tax=Ambispora leptoticha TaxID=144679 RepID=A0A9N8ZA09_9GLOM|nr:12050_t:CDS:2 [Ambispora leptoticha]
MNCGAAGRVIITAVVTEKEEELFVAGVECPEIGVGDVGDNIPVLERRWQANGLNSRKMDDIKDQITVTEQEPGSDLEQNEFNNINRNHNNNKYWSSDEESDEEAPFGYDKIEMIQANDLSIINDIMKNVRIPESAVPEWAKRIPEESWLPRVIAIDDEKENIKNSSSPSSSTTILEDKEK